MALAPDSLGFVITDGRAEVRFRAPALVRIGRGEQCELRLADPGVSRLHARVFTRAGGIWIEDLGSRAGVRVRGEAITRPTEVRPGDEILIGPCALRLEPETEASPRPLPTEPPAAPRAPSLLPALREAIATQRLDDARRIAGEVCRMLEAGGRPADATIVGEATTALLFLTDLTGEPAWLDAVLRVRRIHALPLEADAVEGIARRYRRVGGTELAERQRYVGWASLRTGTAEHRAALARLLA